MRFNLAFSSLSVFRRLSFVTPRSPNYFLHVLLVASDTPMWQHKSTTGVLDSANRSAYEICFSENFDLFIASPCVLLGLTESKLTSRFQKSEIWGEVNFFRFGSFGCGPLRTIVVKCYQPPCWAATARGVGEHVRAD